MTSGQPRTAARFQDRAHLARALPAPTRRTAGLRGGVLAAPRKRAPPIAETWPISEIGKSEPLGTMITPEAPLWKREYLYEPPTPEHPKPRVRSRGSDGKPGGSATAEDIDSDRLGESER